MGTKGDMENGRGNAEIEKRNEFSVDVIFSELGSFGRYQMWTMAIVMLPILCSGIYQSQYIFVAGDMDYRCKVPLCESEPPSFEPGSWASFALPANVKDQRCMMMKAVGSECNADSFVNETVKCDAWLFENDHTIVEAYNLGCQDWKRSLVGTLNSAGIFLALPFTSFISDKYGRRVAFIITAFNNGLVGFIRSFSVNYYMHVILEFLNSALGSGVYSAGFILALEMVGTNRRVLGGNILSCTFATGQVVLALVAWAFPYWRTLMRVLYTPSLFFLLYHFILEESVRWLIVKQRKGEVIRIINKAARFNRVTFSDKIQKMLTAYEESPLQTESEKRDEAQQNSLREIMKSRKLMLRVCYCSFWWITVTFVYYGLSINSVSLAGNKYVNYMLMSLIEIPGYAMSFLALDRIGRKRTMMIAFFICGVGLLILPWIPASLPGLITCIVLISKMMISGAFSGIYVYTVELFPTCARHRLLGACSMFGRIGNILAPQTPLLMVYWESLPYILFGAFSFIASAIMTLTPETLNKSLPDTIEQAENIHKQKDDPHATNSPSLLVLQRSKQNVKESKKTKEDKK